MITDQLAAIRAQAACERCGGSGMWKYPHSDGPKSMLCERCDGTGIADSLDFADFLDIQRKSCLALLDAVELTQWTDSPNGVMIINNGDFDALRKEITCL